MDEIKKIVISYWYQELQEHPKEKIEELEKELKNILDNPFMYNQSNERKLIGMPRIQAISSNHQYLFQMSLINATLSINVNNQDIDEVMLLINNNVQLFFDVLNDVYDTKILYTSIKIEMIEEVDDSANILSKHFDFTDNYEEFGIKRGFIKDDYYINYILNSGKEYNFNISKKDYALDQDILDKTMITSLSKANFNKCFIQKIVEINDRYAYNKNGDYLSSKDNLRGMIIELKTILQKKLYDKKKQVN